MCDVPSLMVVIATSLCHEYLGRSGGSCRFTVLLMVYVGALAEPGGTDLVCLTCHDVSGATDIYDGLPHVAPWYSATGGVCTYWSYLYISSCYSVLPKCSVNFGGDGCQFIVLTQDALQFDDMQVILALWFAAWNSRRHPFALVHRGRVQCSWFLRSLYQTGM